MSEIPILNSYESPKKGLSVISASTFIVGQMAGGGLLSLSSALAGTGWAGIVLLIAFCFNSGVSGVYLAKSWLILEERWPEYRMHVRKPFAAIGGRACGKWMEYIVSITMNITTFGACAVFLLLTSEMINGITNNSIHISYCGWIPIVALVLTPLMWLRSPDDFWPAAYLAMGSTAVGSVLLAIEVLISAKDYIHDASYDAPNFESFFLAFGKILFAYGGISSFPTFQNDMQDRSKFPLAVTIGFISLLVFYLPISLGGYIVYGSSVNSNILTNLDDGAIKTVIQVCFAIHLFFAFLILINPLSLDLEGIEALKIPKGFHWKRCAFRTLLMLIIAFLGASVRKFDKILNLIGGSTVTIMAFLMPPLFYYFLCRQKNPLWEERKISFWEKLNLVQIVIIGITGGSAATYSAIKELVSSSTFTPPCYVFSSGNSTM